MRLIDADALKQIIGSYNPIKYTYEYGFVITVADIDNAPTIEAEKTISKTTALRAEEFAEDMKENAERYAHDEEIAHSIADGIMCDLLRELGYGKGVDIFEDMPRWYA